MGGYEEQAKYGLPSAQRSHYLPSADYMLACSCRRNIRLCAACLGTQATQEALKSREITAGMEVHVSMYAVLYYYVWLEELHSCFSIRVDH